MAEESARGGSQLMSENEEEQFARLTSDVAQSKDYANGLPAAAENQYRSAALQSQGSSNLKQSRPEDPKVSETVPRSLYLRILNMPVQTCLGLRTISI